MENIYEAPKAELADIGDGAVEELKFYVVSLSKFLILFIGTFSLYSVYWFYRHWTNYRIVTGTKLWAVPRAIFSVLFAYSLFSRFDQAASADSAPRYSARSMAIVYVLAAIAQFVCDRMLEAEVGLPITMYLTIGLYPLIAWSLCRAQRVANAACNDPNGAGNRALGAANIAWLVAGAMLWLLLLIGLYGVSVALPQ